MNSLDHIKLGYIAFWVTIIVLAALIIFVIWRPFSIFKKEMEPVPQNYDSDKKVPRMLPEEPCPVEERGTKGCP